MKLNKKSGLISTVKLMTCLTVCVILLSEPANCFVGGILNKFIKKQDKKDQDDKIREAPTYDIQYV